MPAAFWWWTGAGVLGAALGLGGVYVLLNWDKYKTRGRRRMNPDAGPDEFAEVIDAVVAARPRFVTAAVPPASPPREMLLGPCMRCRDRAVIESDRYDELVEAERTLHQFPPVMINGRPRQEFVEGLPEFYRRTLGQDLVERTYGAEAG